MKNLSLKIQFVDPRIKYEDKNYISSYINCGQKLEYQLIYLLNLLIYKLIQNSYTNN